MVKQITKLILRWSDQIVSFRLSINLPLIEYENALLEFDGDSQEAIFKRIISNPLHVYKLVRDTEHFGFHILNPLVEYSYLLNGK